MIAYTRPAKILKIVRMYIKYILAIETNRITNIIIVIPRAFKVLINHQT